MCSVRAFGRTCIAVFLLLFSGAGAYAQGAAALSQKPAAVAARSQIDALFAKVRDGVEIGFIAVECDGGETWCARQSHKPLKPGSVMKLFTTAAALHRFGPDFEFETRVYLHDDELLVLGGGDPGLGDERLAERRGEPLHGEFDVWAGKLKQRGVVSLKTIALDDSIFDQQHRHPEWPADQASAWYQAPAGGLNFNDNCLDARFTAANGVVTIHTVPALPPEFIRNEIKAAARHRPIATRAPGQDVFIFRGTASRDDGFKPVSAGRPTVFFGHALEENLRRRGVTLDGSVVRRKLTPAALAEAALIDRRATSMEEVLWRTNTFSQNMFAECLLKSLAAYAPNGERTGAAGSWDAGVAIVRDTMLEFGLDLDGAVLCDGSGLSHSNRVSAAQITDLLRAMHKHRFGEQYKNSLARPGESGTLRGSQWRTPNLRTSLRAKTGSLNGVRAIAGFVTRPDGVQLAFALLINGDLPQDPRPRVAEILASVDFAAAETE